jgi:hypothetical protein
VRLHFAAVERSRSYLDWEGVVRLLGVGWPIATKQVGRVEAEQYRPVVVEQNPRVVVEPLLAVVAADPLVIAVLLAYQFAVCLEPGGLEAPGVHGTHRGYSSSSSKVGDYSYLQSCQQVRVHMIVQPVVHGCRKD